MNSYKEILCDPLSTHGREPPQGPHPTRERPPFDSSGFLGPLFPRLFPTLLTKAHGLREFRTRLGVVRSHHRIIRREIPIRAVFLRRHLVAGTKVSLERFVLFPVEERDQVVARDRLLDGYGWFAPWRLRRLRLTDVVQCCMNRTYKRGKITSRDRVVTYIGANDFGGHQDISLCLSIAWRTPC